MSKIEIMAEPEFNSLEGTEPIKRIHYKLKEFYSSREFGEAKKFISLLLNDDIEVSYLMTILIISKKFKEHEDLKDLLLKVEELIISKTNKPVL